MLPPLLSNVKVLGDAGRTIGVLAANGEGDELLVKETTVGVQVAPDGFAVTQAVVVAKTVGFAGVVLVLWTSKLKAAWG